MAAVRRGLLLGAAFAVAGVFAHAEDFQGATHMMPFEEDTINYNNAARNRRGGTVAKAARCRRVTFKHEDAYGYLLALLDELKVPKSSQMLVFSKTSLQREHISPSTPRSIFFSDDVYVGFIPGAPLIEVSVADPKLGAVFYTLDQTKPDKPKLTRNNQCLECHASAKTMGVPGHLVRSFATDESGVVDFSSGISQVNHRTPLEERWGGWYVTGTHGQQTHRGNLIGKAAFERQTKEPNHAGNVTNLSAYFDVSRYVAQPERHRGVDGARASDAHAQFHHAAELRGDDAAQAVRPHALSQEHGGVVSEIFALHGRGAADQLRFTAARSLRKTSRRKGRRDKRGRSLRDFDLHTRLFKYPCSYLIYSDAFDALPAPMKEHLYPRLWEILSGKDQSATYASLSPATRQAIQEILAETQRDLSDFWKKESAAASAAPHTRPLR